MPYLKADFIDEIERHTDWDSDVHYFASLPEQHFAGAVNYINYTIAKIRFRKSGKFRRYYQFAGWVGTMFLCILEVWWRLIRDYEDEKIKENGDV